MHNSDHHLIYVELLTNLSVKEPDFWISRDMRKIRANPNYFMYALKEIDWLSMAIMVWDVDEMVKFWTSSIVRSLDKVAPLKTNKYKPKRYCLPDEVKEEVKKRNKLFYELNLAKEAMKVHEKAHENEKPFKCAQCDKEFANSTDLNKHVSDNPLNCFQGDDTNQMHEN